MLPGLIHKVVLIVLILVFLTINFYIIIIVINTDGYFLPLGRVAPPGCNPVPRLAMLTA